MVGQRVFGLELLPTEGTIILDEILVDVSHVDLQHTAVLEALPAILAVKV